jgi:uncharacterized protein YjbI with pentapeptide repeats
MANQEHLEVLLAGVKTWNKWRRQNPGIRPDLSGEDPTDDFAADIRLITSAVLNEVMPGQVQPDSSDSGPLTGMILTDVDFRDADLTAAKLNQAVMISSRLDGATLEDADLSGAVLTSARLKRANLSGANLNATTLRWADASYADFSRALMRLVNADGICARRADLRECDLFYASLVRADLRWANLSDAHVYGVSAWDVRLEHAVQERLTITTATEPAVTVDDLQVAQFLRLILNNQRIRGVIDSLATRVVLILGRFTPPRKAVLTAVAKGLRGRGLIPVIFDFERPTTRDFTETVVTLAHLSKFIVADLTDPASLPAELEAIVPRLAVPVVPILERGNSPYALFTDYWKYDWVLDIVEYRSADELVKGLDKKIIAAAASKIEALTVRRSGQRST